MKSRLWNKGLGVAFLTTWSGSASALDLVLSGSVERSVSHSRVELLATLIVPLDEWGHTLPSVAAWVKSGELHSQAWHRAEQTTAEFGGSGRLHEPEEGMVLRHRALLLAQSAQEPPGGTMPPPGRIPAERTASSTKEAQGPKLDGPFIKGLMLACSGEFKDGRSRLDDLAERARLAAWLPEIQVRGGRNTDQSLRLTPTEAEPDRYQVVGGNGVRIEGQVRWSFSQLVFARDELAVARLRGALEVERRKRQQQAMDALTRWFGAWTKLAAEASEPDDLLEAWIAENALRAELDWLSQGWFSAHVPPAPERSVLLGQTP